MGISAAEVRRSFDAIIVGNGALGTSLGVVLASRGMSVALVGERTRPWCASAAAGAMLGCFGEVTSALLESKEGRAKLDLDVRASALWESWLAELAHLAGDDGAVRTASGTIVMLNAIGVPELDTANYQAIRAALTEYHESFEDIDPGDIAWLRPEPTSRPLRAMYLPGEHCVDASALLLKLDAAFTRSGGVLVPQAAVAPLYASGQVTGVTLASGDRLAAPTVVIAAGVRSVELLRDLPDIARRIPPMVSGYGVSALVETGNGAVPDAVVRTPNRAFACGLHALPRVDGSVYLGATNIISALPRTTAQLSNLQFLLDCATRQLRTDLSAAGLLRVQVGNRPVSADGFPLFGSVGVPGLWMMTGTYRDGFHQSPLLAYEMARRILGGEPELDLERFRPVRSPLQPMSRQEVIEATVAHTLATGYEDYWRVSNEWPPRMEAHLRRWYERLLDELDPDYTPPPELIVSMQPEIEGPLRAYYAASR